MTEHHESQKPDSVATAVVDPHVAALAGRPGRCQRGEPVLAQGPVSWTTLRARLALLRPRALKAQPKRASRF
jgi:hypothetical protein